MDKMNSAEKSVQENGYYSEENVEEELIQSYRLTNFCTEDPYKPLSSNEILVELEKSRVCYLVGEGEDLDKVLDEIGSRYGL